MEKNKKKDNQIIGGLILSLALMWGGFFLSYYQGETLRLAIKEKTQETKQIENKTTELKKNFFSNLNLEAKAYIIYNPETGEIITGKNENQILPLASLSKVMTVLVAEDEAGPEATIKIGEIPQNNSLRKGEKWSLVNLASLTLVSSSNEGAAALAQVTTGTSTLVDLMNKKAKDLNLGQMSFLNTTGLDINSTPSNLGSALSVAKLFSYILKNKSNIFEVTRESAIRETSQDGFSHTAINTNKIVNQIPGLLISKTGYTETAGGNLAIVANVGLRRPLVFVVLGSSQDGRFTDTQKLTLAATNYYASINK